MIAIATLISAVASLVVAGVAVYNGVKQKKDTAQKIEIIAQEVPAVAKALLAVEEAAKNVSRKP